MALFTSYDAVGIKEDVSDIITNISPTKTPFQSVIGREKITQKVFQWQEDVLRPAAVNAQYEGFEATYGGSAPAVGQLPTPTAGTAPMPGTLAFDSLQATVMRQNNTQIFAEAVAVSGTMEATSTYGRARESAYQLAKAAAAVKRDLEIALVGMNQSAATFTPAGANAPGASTGGSVGSVRRLGSYSGLLLQNPLSVNDGQELGYQGQNVTYSALGTVGANNQATYNGGAVVDATTALPVPTNPGLSEGALIQALENCYNNGAEPDCIYVTPSNANVIAGFAKAAGRTRFIQDNSPDNKQVVNAVDLYVSPFGEVRVYLNRFQNGSGAYPASAQTGNTWTLVVDPSMWVLCTLRPWFREVLAKTGDNIKQMIVGEFSLKLKNALASSLVVDTTAAVAAGTAFPV